MDAKAQVIQALAAHITREISGVRWRPFSETLLDVPGVELIDFWGVSNTAEDNKVWEHPLAAAQTDKDFNDFCAHGKAFYFCDLYDVGLDYAQSTGGKRQTFVFMYGRLGNTSEYNIRLRPDWESFYSISPLSCPQHQRERAIHLRALGCDIPLQPGEAGYQEELFT